MKDRKILVPLDESSISAQTVQGLLARKESITLPLTLLHVLDPRRISYEGFGTTPREELERRAVEGAQQFLAGQQAVFVAAGVAVNTLFKQGYAREVICALADSGEFDLLVIGRKPDTDLRNLLFGQVANHVIHTVKCPVLIL
ncbi:MAG: universal stress protein [Trichloromonadaceae bacterium]